MGWIQDYHQTGCRFIGPVRFAVRSSYCNQEFDALIAHADETPNLEEALPLYRAAGDLLLADAPAAVNKLWGDVYLVAPNLFGLREHTSLSDTVWVGQYGPTLIMTLTRKGCPTLTQK